jgi:glutaredoxin 3
MKDVIIYSTPVCHFCQLAKEFFKEHNIAYTEYDVAADRAKREEMVEKSGQLGVPVIEIGDDVMIGYSEKALRQALDIK